MATRAYNGCPEGDILLRDLASGNITDPDTIFGAIDVENDISAMAYDIPSNLYTGAAAEDITGGVDKVATGKAATGKTKGEAAQADPTDAIFHEDYSADDGPEMDPSITVSDMLTVLQTAIKHRGIAKHHIDSANDFYSRGANYIMTKVFAIDHTIKNTREKTEEDQQITSINFHVDFTDVRLYPPSTIKILSGRPEMLTPNMARIKNLTYSAQMYVDAKITATAVLKSGGTKVMKADINNHRIAAIPCMVGSNLCHTHGMSRDMLKEIQEDPRGHGGQVIVGGNEIAVECLENLTYNTFHVFKNMHQREIARGAFLSKPGDSYENSFQIILRYLTDGSITLEITAASFNGLEMPFYLIFRALGMTRDYDIVDNIVYGVGRNDPVTSSMEEILQRAFTLPESSSVFGKIVKSTDSAEIIQFLGERMIDSSNVANARKDKNAMKYLNTNALQMFDKHFLPHIGNDPSSRIRKLRFLGHLIHRLLRVALEVLPGTDRDSYKDKRVMAAFVNLAKAFKTYVNKTIIQGIRRNLSQAFRNHTFSDVKLAKAVEDAIRPDDLETMLVQAISTGTKTITVKKNEVQNRLSKQALNYKNDMTVISILNTIAASSQAKANKQNERATEMRMPHTSSVYGVDPSQSPDSGEKVGMTKQMGCTAVITGSTSSHALKNMLMRDPAIIDTDTIEPRQISNDQLAKVFVNGDWIGCCRDSHILADRYRAMRRRGIIHRHTTIIWESLVREVHFWTDTGRIVVPLVIVYNNLSAYIARRRAGDRSFKFHQWSLLRREHIERLQSGDITIEDLCEARVVEYISLSEYENIVVAYNIDEFRLHEYNVTRRFTHIGIDQAILGFVSLSAPAIDHSSTSRVTMYTNHRRAAASWYALNWPYRMDKGTTLLHYGEVPMITTIGDRFTLPNGSNTIVALMLYGGYNQEDSALANRSSVECGMMNRSVFGKEQTELEKGEEFGIQDRARTRETKREAIYEHLDARGFIREGIIARKGYVLIAKAAKLQKNTDDTDVFTHVDRSVVYKKDEPMYVERVIPPYNAVDIPMVKIKLRAFRPLIVGDKMSSRMGNKGIVSSMVTRIDMPYCEDGLVPDLVISPQSVPTRMAINQIIECLLACLAVRRGCHIDATTFIPLDVAGALKMLKERFGMEYGGHRRMYNGRTGEWIDTLIFMGPTTYQPQQKYVTDDNQAMTHGPTEPDTKQPTEGKAREGGLRLGEMEKDTYNTHGTMAALYEKFYTDSDGTKIYICRRCGNRAVVNERISMYACKKCGDAADIAAVHSAHCANMFINETSAMNIKMLFELRKFMYSRPE